MDGVVEFGQTEESIEGGGGENAGVFLGGHAGKRVGRFIDTDVGKGGIPTIGELEQKTVGGKGMVEACKLDECLAWMQEVEAGGRHTLLPRYCKDLRLRVRSSRRV